MRNVLVAAVLIALTSVSCENEKPKEPKKVSQSKERISSVKVLFGANLSGYTFHHNSDGSLRIDADNQRQNVSMLINYNETHQITQLISGKERIEYIYDPNGNISLIEMAGKSHEISFAYNNKKQVVSQFNVFGTDTVERYTYGYKNDVLHTVRMQSRFGYDLEFQLQFDTLQNPFSNVFEWVYPQEMYWYVGLPALYSANNLISARLTHDRSSSKVDENKLFHNKAFEGFSIVVSQSQRRTQISTNLASGSTWSVEINYETY